MSFFVDAVQEKLLSEYEAELKTKKPTHAKKDSNASDDWEKLSDEGKWETILCLAQFAF